MMVPRYSLTAVSMLAGAATTPVLKKPER